MNLDSRDVLEGLMADNEKLLKAIEETKGFILHKLKKFDLIPDLNLLLDNLSIFNIQFIKDNYKLNAEQKFHLSSFLSEETLTNIKLTLSEEQVNKMLKDETVLPKNTVLTLEQLNSYPKEIKLQNSLEGNHMDDILENSVSKLNLDEILNLNPVLLKEEYFLMNYQPLFFNNLEYRNLYKKLVFESVLNPTIHDFRNYHFSNDDKEFLEFLLKNTIRRYSNEKYYDLTHIVGFKDLITKFEYFKSYNSRDYSLFSDGEIENNIEFFRQQILDDNDNIDGYEAFKTLVNKKMSISQFKIIIDEELIKKLLAKTVDMYGEIGRFFGHMDTSNKPMLLDKRLYLSNIILKLYSQDTILENGFHLKDVINPSDVASLIDDLAKENSPYVEIENAKKIIIELNQNIDKIYKNVIPYYLQTDKLEDLYTYAHQVFNETTINKAHDFFADNVSVNSFLVLTKLKSLLNEKKYEKQNIILKKIDETLSTLQKKLLATNDQSILASVKIIQDFHDMEDSRVKSLLKVISRKKLVQKPDDSNFLMYEGKELSLIPEGILNILYDMHKEFRNYVLKSNLKVPKSLLHHSLYKSDASDILFLKEYVKLHRHDIEADKQLVSSFLGSSHQSEIFPLSSEIKEDEIYKKLMICISEQKILLNKRNLLGKLFPHADFPYEIDKDFKDIDTFDINVDIPTDISKSEAENLYIKLYTLSEQKEKQVCEYTSMISCGFINNKIKNLIKVSDFSSIKAIKENRVKYTDEPLIEYINNLSFSKLKKHLDDQAFVSLLQEMVGYDRNTAIRFPTYSYNENFELAIKLLEKFKKEDSSSAHNFLCFFPPENRDFIKEFAITYLPKEVFYSYDFLPESYEGYKPSKFIKGEYSNEEIYEAYKNLQKKGGMFSELGPNADFKTFFTSVFFSENKSKKEELTDVRFKDFLAFIKDKDEMLYSMMAAPYVFQQSLKYGKGYNGKQDEKYKTRDEAINNYFHETFDLDVVLKGLKKIIDIMNDPPLDDEGCELINRKVAGNCITHLIHNTYYEDFDEYGRSRLYLSVTSEEDTTKIMKFLYVHAPQHLVERHVIGKANHPVDYFSEHIDEFSNLEDIKNFILPNSGVIAEYLSLGSQPNSQQPNSQLERLCGFVRALVTNAIEKYDHATIDYLKFIFNQHNFLDKEVRWDLKSKAYEGKDDIFLHYLCKDKNLVELVDKSQLKMVLDESLKINIPSSKRRNKI